jgi:outer membrane protein OmpA-like peptidoglycan-associated protein
VQFAYDSAELSTETVLALRNLGNALADERLASLRFHIIGHTDAVGTEAYNDELSRRRAAAVLEHLVFYYELDAAQFVSFGRGESQLFDPAHPDSGENRRVEIQSFVDQ